MRDKITNDIFLRILTETYLFRVDEINRLICEILFRYINILKYVNSEIEIGDKNYVKLFEKVETARAILFFLGYYYCEDFGRGAIERRLGEFDITPLRFYEIIDRQGHFDLSLLKVDQAERFREIVRFYTLLKHWKNLTISNYKLYFAEDYFNQTRDLLIKKVEQDLGKSIKPNEWYWVQK